MAAGWSETDRILHPAVVFDDMVCFIRHQQRLGAGYCWIQISTHLSFVKMKVVVSYLCIDSLSFCAVMVSQYSRLTFGNS